MSESRRVPNLLAHSLFGDLVDARSAGKTLSFLCGKLRGQPESRGSTRRDWVASCLRLSRLRRVLGSGQGFVEWLCVRVQGQLRPFHPTRTPRPFAALVTDKVKRGLREIPSYLQAHTRDVKGRERRDGQEPSCPTRQRDEQGPALRPELALTRRSPDGDSLLSSLFHSKTRLFEPHPPLPSCWWTPA